MSRVLLLLPTASYRNADFLAAGRALGVEIVAAADYCHRLAPLWGLHRVLALPFAEPGVAAEKALAYLEGVPDAVLAVDDHGLEVAALIAARLGLPGNPPPAVRTLRDKLAFRRLQQRSGLAHPPFRHLPEEADAAALAAQLAYPVVVKARRLNASRGVIRADAPAQLVRAAQRVRAIQRRADRDAAALGIVVEGFVPGSEHAVEGLLTRGVLDVLALFDKPDPLDGPYFQETIYVTPSRLARDVQGAIAAEVARACRAAGVVTGPVHAEIRLTAAGPVLLEVAARSIGGLCARVLRHGLGISLEELILRHALGLALPQPAGGDGAAAGVMMIPIPARGILAAVSGVEDARAIAGIEDVVVSATAGEILVPPPEGGAYLGFIFARAATADEAETALRAAHAKLRFDLRPEIPLRESANARSRSHAR